MGKGEEFETGHQDRVTVIHTNFNGTRILTASIDHRIKVWHRDSKTGERTLIDTFTAHDADIRDVRSLSLLCCPDQVPCNV
jgi:WD40 repeat protein